MNSFIICLGSNTENRDTILLNAVEAINRVSTDTKSTSPYPCKSYNGLGATYHNIVMVGFTTHDINEFTVYTKQLEIGAGRCPDSKSTGIMPLDIDLIIWNDTIISADDYEREHFTIGYNKLLIK